MMLWISRQRFGRIAALGSLLALLPMGTGIASAASPFDGTYKGSYTIIRTDNSAGCATTAHTMTINVVDGRFRRTWAGAVLDVVVKPDGTFRGEAVRPNSTQRGMQRFVIIEGKIEEGRMRGEFGHAVCAVSMNALKEP